MSAPAIAPATTRPAAAAPDMIQGHPVATLLIDSAGCVLQANQAAETLLNRAASALRGARVSALLPWRDRSSIDRLLGEAAESLWAWSLEIENGKEGVLHADLALGAPLPESGARVLAIQIVPRAGRIIGRKPGSGARSAEAAAALLAHEIKNPLSGIRGAAQILGKNGGDKSSALSRLICGEVDRIAALIDSMQGFTTGQPAPLTSINIYPAIAQATGIATSGFAASVTLTEAFDPSLPRVMANHDGLVQILINLIKNSTEALNNTDNPTIRLTTAFRHGLSWDAGDGRGHRALPIEIMVEDNGPGVPDAIADAIFDPFVSGKREGQGLGLALVDKLARDMGGFVQHRRRGEWTAFSLHLPLAPTSAQAAIP